MNEQKIHYCFTLSEEQMEYLRSKKYKIDRMECFMSLVTLAVRETKLEQLSKTQQVEILPGQFMVNNTELAQLWDKDRKTVPKLLEAMEQHGIFSSQKVGDNRIYTLHSLSGWYIGGEFKSNEFTLKRNETSTAIFHKDVPAAKVVVIEPDDTKDGKNKGKDKSAANGGKSTDGNEGKNPATNAAAPQPASQSNDSAVEGKSQADGSSSLSSHDDKFPQGNVAQDGKANEGKQVATPSPQQGGQQKQNPLPQSGGQPQQPNNNGRPQGNDINGNYHNTNGNSYQNGWQKHK